MADACFPVVRSFTKSQSSCIEWAEVDLGECLGGVTAGGHAHPESTETLQTLALQTVRWYCRENGLNYKHFLRVHFHPGNTDNGIYTFAFRDASTARLWRDVLMDPNLDPPGLLIDRNGTPEPFTVPRENGQPSLGKLFHELKNMGGIVEDKLLKSVSQENIDAWVRDRYSGQPSDGDDGSGGGGGDGSSSQAGMTPPAIPPSSSLVQPPMLERQRVNQPARSARSARSVRNGEGASSVQVRLDFGQPLKRQSAWEKAGDMLPKLNEYWSSEARGGGAGAGGLDSGCAPSREPEGDRTDGSSAKKAKTTHQKATSECAGQAEASRPQAGRQGRTEDVIVISDDEERIATAAGPSGVSGGEETETLAGIGSSLQSQTFTLPFDDDPFSATPEPDDPPSGSAPC